MVADLSNATIHAIEFVIVAVLVAWVFVTFIRKA